MPWNKKTVGRKKSKCEHGLMLSRQPLSPISKRVNGKTSAPEQKKSMGGMKDLVTDVKSLMYIPLVSTNPMGPIDRCLLVCVEYHGGKVGY
jgi:hypothetical protein